MRTTRTVAAIIFSSIIAVSALAGLFSPGRIAQDAQWVAYADLGQARDTRLGEFVMGEIDNGRAQKKIVATEAICHFDIRKDIESVTLYGSTAGNGEGVMLATGNFDQSQILTLLKGKDSYARVQKDGYTVHSWSHQRGGGEKRSFGTFAPDGTIVVAESIDSVIKALQVLDGRAPSLGSNSILNLANQGPASFMAAAIDMEGNPKMPPRAAILRQSRNMVFSVKEISGRLKTRMILQTKNAETALNVDTVARGMLAMMLIQKSDSREFAEMVQQVDIVTEGTTVTIDFSCPVDKLIDLYYSRKKSTI